tara:strand:- start:51 stop:1064 length:1014 start_codon:yes stop_codon:yes gene_type:complete
MSITKVIAEIGVNHNGSISLAKDLVDAAVECGADFVKFQAFKADSLVTTTASKADYQITNTRSNSSQHSMLKKLEFDEESHFKIKDYCQSKSIGFMTSPFDVEGVDLVERLSMSVLKIPSGEITNYLLLERAAEFKGQIILSTGMATLEEIGNSLGILLSKNQNRDRITVLQCTTEYPAPFDSLNLRAMTTIADAYNTKVGFSDHSLGIEASLAAVALGASIIEKHITLDTNMEGPDHKASLPPAEFKVMVEMIRNIERSLGSGVKQPSEPEAKNISIARKSLVALQPIKPGDIFTRENLGCKRPGSGVSPMLYPLYLGACSEHSYQPDDLIRPITK